MGYVGEWEDCNRRNAEENGSTENKKIATAEAQKGTETQNEFY